MIRGGRDAGLRERPTRATLKTLAAKELLTQETSQRLLEAYTFLRNLEHRLQYRDDAQTHALPSAEEERLVIAQMMGFADASELMVQTDNYRQFVALQFDAISVTRAALLPCKMAGLIFSGS